jgi:c-di-GMP-binding flagellar brake protein YcgR
MSAAAPPERILDPRRIRHILERLRARRATLAARLHPSPVVASTLIVDLQLGQILLDALFPATAHRAVQPGATLPFSARLDGVAVQGQLRVRAIEHRGDGDLIRTDLPDELLWSQRRAHYRAPAAELPVGQVLYDGAPLRAHLLDLSVSGLGATIATERELAAGASMVWELRLPEAPLVATLRLCSALPGGGLVRVGGEYLALTPAQRHLLQRTVTELQREALRRLHRR